MLNIYDSDVLSFMKEQAVIEKKLNDIVAIINELDKFEQGSIREFYKKKEEVDKLIDYAEDLNNFDYSKFVYCYNSLKENNFEGLHLLKDFFTRMQSVTFDLNICLNTYVENIINCEMAMDLLSEKYLKETTDKVTYRLWEFDTQKKLQHVEKKICSFLWVKNFKTALKNISRSDFWEVFLPYFFRYTNWKYWILTDYKKYLFFRQYLYRYYIYSMQLFKKSDFGNLFDMHIQELYMNFLSNWDSFSFKLACKKFLNVLDHYPVLDSVKTILRMNFSMLGVEISASWEVDYKRVNELIDNDISVETKTEISQIANILYFGVYDDKIENFKDEFWLDSYEYELFKDLRYAFLFLEGSKITTIFLDKKFNKIKEKLQDSNYFQILLNYGMNFNAVFWGFLEFDISRLQNIIKQIESVDKEELPDMFAYDLEYMHANIISCFENLK